ncbi:hypothetical protein HK099_001563 [Clydaea vesicula]|uniref:VWFA domain-containing protein n=1 Tax=Clydaea vesicula TaxID=447962 RepID=A0AAD5Y1T2_9FUNG|nr:hypothetical protein HK099_001563 [Clydaea vesicula]
MNVNLDLVFAIDCTGSMVCHIAVVKQKVNKMVEEICNSKKAHVRLGLVGYRDYDTEDAGCLIKVYPFTDSMSTIQTNVNELLAAGGGDCEAFALAFHNCRNLTWRDNCTKIVVIIADAPPHGIGEWSDKYPGGDPSGFDSIKIAYDMATSGVVVYSLYCPDQYGFTLAQDYFKKISSITGGLYLPIENADSLPEIIIGSIKETLSLEQILEQLKDEIEVQRSKGLEKEQLSKVLHEGHSNTLMVENLAIVGGNNDKVLMLNKNVSLEQVERIIKWDSQRKKKEILVKPKDFEDNTSLFQTHMVLIKDLQLRHA